MAFMQNEENIFTPSPLPSPLQLSSIEDFYIDGNKIYYVGNYTGNVSELGPSLSNSGGVLTGFDGYNYDSHKSLGLPINYEARHIDKINKNSLLIIGNNNRAYKLNLIEN